MNDKLLKAGMIALVRYPYYSQCGEVCRDTYWLITSDVYESYSKTNNVVYFCLDLTCLVSGRNFSWKRETMSELLYDFCNYHEIIGK